MTNSSKLFRELMSKVGSYTNENLDLLSKAYLFSNNAHMGQKRLSGDDFITHPINVALILAGWKADITSITAAILHDTVEDTKVTLDSIRKNFGEEVALIVDGVTKITNIRFTGDDNDIYVENLRKMIVAMSKDLRVILVKLADRTHNLQTLKYLEKEKQIVNARETVEIYAPLAERLGMGQVKSTLEDLAFFYLYPRQYEKVKDLSNPLYKKAETLLEDMKKKILKELKIENIEPLINYRKKHLYSLWKKLERPEINWDFEKIYDISAMRIIVSSVDQCYVTLGIVHKYYKPVPFLGISDFIAQPKPNGYQSIHTKVFSKGERIVEIQIRTKKMHEEAEYGVAAHWAYSETKQKTVSDEKIEKQGVFAEKEKLHWIRQLMEWQNEMKNSEDFLSAVKFDVLGERIFVFSPNGDVFDLPKGATPVDFAYAVHSDLGDYIGGAKVNGKMVGLEFQLKNGDLVEIVKLKTKKTPSSDWLEFAKTNLALGKIKKSLRKLS